MASSVQLQLRTSFDSHSVEGIEETLLHVEKVNFVWWPYFIAMHYEKITGLLHHVLPGQNSSDLPLGPTPKSYTTSHIFSKLPVREPLRTPFNYIQTKPYPSHDTFIVFFIKSSCSAELKTSLFSVLRYIIVWLSVTSGSL